MISLLALSGAGCHFRGVVGFFTRISNEEPLGILILRSSDPCGCTSCLDVLQPFSSCWYKIKRSASHSSQFLGMQTVSVCHLVGVPAVVTELTVVVENRLDIAKI